MATATADRPLSIGRLTRVLEFAERRLAREQENVKALKGQIADRRAAAKATKQAKGTASTSGAGGQMRP